MKSNEEFLKEVLDTMEKMVDNRFTYLREKSYENHAFASKLLKEEYEPVKKKLYELLKKGLTPD